MATATNSIAKTRPSTPAAPNVLVNELLGFSPQLLLDAIIDIANDAIGKAATAMESQLNRWADDRARNADTDDWDSAQEIEQGIVAFMTLLEFHTDVAFDFFETWSLRNIFTLPANLAVIAPHQVGLNLNTPPERESELLAEIEDLRRQIDNQHRLRRLVQRAERITAARAGFAKRRLMRAAALRPPNVDALRKAASEIVALYDTASALPDPDPSQIQPPQAEPGKELWRAGKAGYADWAVSQLLAQAKKADGDPLPGAGSGSGASSGPNMPRDAEAGELAASLKAL